MTQPSAKIIADSLSPDGVRLTTMEVIMHRFVLAEFNTHRAFSRNSASSRAIPYSKIRQRVVDNIAYPVKWSIEQAGMQGGNQFLLEDIEVIKRYWDLASNKAITIADWACQNKLHKSLVNRLLEPFMWHTVIVTATEWDNFFWQRCHPDAQPEMKAAADAMQFAYYTHIPEQIDYSEWHLPFITEEDFNEATDKFTNYHAVKLAVQQISVARCARVSYLNHDGTRSIEKDLELYEKLTQGQHWSPFEHVATPLIKPYLDSSDWSGNFRGWKQFRKEFQNENRGNFIPNHSLLTSKIGSDETIKSQYTDREL